jgi:thymidine phosphorylase
MFKAKKVNIKTHHRLIAVLLEKDAKELGVKNGERIKIIPSSKKGKSIICELEIVDRLKNKLKSGEKCISSGEIGIFETAFEKLEISDLDRVKIVPAPKPKSLEYIRDKFYGKIRFTESMCEEIIKDIVENRFSEIETTYFVLASTAHQLDDNETINLTKAMVKAGKVLNFNKKRVVDKHCIGGIPNNRTTMIVVPIIAVAGLTIPKTSSRSITSPAGTADTMEVLTNVSLSLSEMYDVVKKENGCIVWGGSLDLSPADDLIINVEHPLDLDSEGQMIASILSKKKSAGSTDVLIDIPIGQTAKVESLIKGYKLMRRIEKIGRNIGLNVKCILTDGYEPIGKGIGPLYEALDVLKILKREEDAPKDLEDKALMMAGLIFEMVDYCKKGEGKIKAREILDSGKAYEKFMNIIKAQGGPKKLPSAKYKVDILAHKDGKVKSIHNKKIAKLAFVLGAPEDKAAGLIIHKKTDEIVEKDKPILTIYSNSKLKLEYGKAYLEDNKDIIELE